MRISSLFMFVTSLLLSQTNFAKPQHCDATFQGKAFAQVTIWSSIDGYGPTDCVYKNPADQKTIVYHMATNQDYYPVSGNWQSTMPGYQWCSIENGNQFDSCLFAKREK